MWNTVQKLVGFRVCRTLETFPCTPRAHQHQKIHLQHEIKIWIFFDILFMCFWGWFSSKIWCFLQSKPYLTPNTLARKGVFTAKIIKISTKINPKITWKWCRKFFNFLFYVANVFFDAGELEECMETFLESYRLEKPLFFALYFT